MPTLLHCRVDTSSHGTATTTIELDANWQPVQPEPVAILSPYYPDGIKDDERGPGGPLVLA